MTTAQPRESAIVRAILTNLNKISGCLARKRHGDVYSTAGDPDITGCYCGHHFEIEVKRPGQEPTRLQQRRLDEWKWVGAATGVATSVGEAVAIVRGIQ